MKPKPIVPRKMARRDVDSAVDYYQDVGGAAIAEDFVSALQTAYRGIGKRPNMGSPIYGHELGIAELRTRRLTRFPYLVFYIERDDHIDVWRVLHMRRDIHKAITGRSER